MSIAVDVPAGTGARGPIADFDDAFEFGPDGDPSTAATARRACPECAVVLLVDVAADGATVPDHAVCPSARDPFGIRSCPGSGTVFGDSLERAGSATPEPPPRPAVTVLPAGLDWRAQPFSHTV